MYSIFWVVGGKKSKAGSSEEEEAVPSSSAAASFQLLGTGCKAETQAATRSAGRRKKCHVSAGKGQCLEGKGMRHRE
jgi:hypothetical protein